MSLQEPLSPEDSKRIDAVLHALACRLGCDAKAAIDVIEQALAEHLKTRAEAEPRRRVIAFADRVRRVRIRRNEMLGTTAFRDPAWDMLLDLLVANDEGREMSVGTLCMGSGVPPTTALRYIDYLVSEGLIERQPDGDDARRTIVRLNPARAGVVEEIVARLHACA